MSWVDHCLVAGNKEAVKTAKPQMKDPFDGNDVSKPKEHLGREVTSTVKSGRSL
jgi:hypothetical protein